MVGGVIKAQTTTTGIEVFGNNAGLVLPEHASAMAQPPAGKMAVYGRTNGRPYVKDSAGRERPLVDIDPSVCDFRLSLVLNTPVMTTNVAAAATLYLTPFSGNRIAFYDPAEAVWDVISAPSNAVSLGALLANTVYDVFAFNNGGVVASVEFVAWTSATARATAIVFQDGVPCKSGDLSRRLIGTIRTGAAAGTMDWNFGGTGAGGVAANLGIWHANPKVRVPVAGMVRDSTDSWTYAVTAWRAANNSGAMRLNLLDGDGALQVKAAFGGIGNPPSTNYASVGIGLDSTTALAAKATATVTGTTGVQHGGTALYSGDIGLGWHYLQALECRLQGTGTITFYGDNGIAFFQNGFSYEGDDMSLDRGKLHDAIAAVCPIEGVRIGRVDDRASWAVVAAPEATPEQMQAALEVLAAFDPDAPSIEDVRASAAAAWCSSAARATRPICR